jgi:hypothetical protein
MNSEFVFKNYLADSLVRMQLLKKENLKYIQGCAEVEKNWAGVDEFFENF